MADVRPSAYSSVFSFCHFHLFYLQLPSIPFLYLSLDHAVTNCQLRYRVLLTAPSG
jgi:hypothetical protein